MNGVPDIGAGAWRRRKGLSVTEVEDDAFVVDPATDEIFQLNAIGRALWTLMETPLTLAEMTATLRAAFPDAPRDAIETDAEAFIRRMARRRLIEPAD